MARRGGRRTCRYYAFGVALSGLALSCAALSASPTAATAPAPTETLRAVEFFFSSEAWGGVPFSEAERQGVMVDALLSGEPKSLEANVLHLLSTPDARVRRFVAVFEVDGSVRPPTMKTGFELELLVPRARETLSVELINAETGVVNLVEVAPEGAL